MNKVKLIHYNTPIQKLNYSFNGTCFYMKRDDLIDFGCGGNKVRLFEYIAADILKQRAQKVITFGSIHSNHIRVAANVAKYLGIACDLLVLYEKECDCTIQSPNLKLINYCDNVKIVFCETSKAHEFIDEYLENETKSGERFYWIPGGGHTALAAEGYADAGREILMQAKGIQLDAIFLPCGTGTTQAGLIVGIDNTISVYGVTVARDIKRCKEEIYALLLQMESRQVNINQINVLHNKIKYGEKCQEVNNIISTIVKSDGIYLDPIYNAKSFLVMSQFVARHPELKNVLYINTGGSPNLFSM